MGSEINTKAYSIFLMLEVGLREFLISLIIKKGIANWFQDFLTTNNRDTLNEIKERVYNATKNQIEPSIEDQYIVKLNRALKSQEVSFYSKQLFHPFYYLSWPDIESLFKRNSPLIDGSIGKHNRQTITNILSSINSLRNDVAHSRYITENELLILEGAYMQIASLIPDFTLRTEIQSIEDSISERLNKLHEFIGLIETSELLSLEEIERIKIYIDNCLSSFWLNSILMGLVNELRELEKFMETYHSLRQSHGGLLKILKLKQANIQLLSRIKLSIKDE